MQSYDVIVVGGGPAGSTCAWALQRTGLHVLVLDKSQFPRDKVCAGWITPEVARELELDLNDYQQHLTLQAFNSFRTGLFGARMVTTDYGHTVSYGILRREFDHYLLQRSGAKLCLGESVEQLDYQHGLWQINNKLQTPMLIGAGGHFCPVSRRLNPKNKDRQEIVAAQEMELELDETQQSTCVVQGDTPELYFLPELDGYAWSVRKGRYINIGLGRTDNHRLSHYVARFRDSLVAQGRIPANLDNRFRGHAYRLAPQRRRRQIIADGAILIGDAAGLAYPKSGEGIYTAIKSGLLAAETVLAAQNNYQADYLTTYLDKLNQFFGDKDSAPGLSLPNRVERLLAPWLFGNAVFSRRILLDKWFLHR